MKIEAKTVKLNKITPKYGSRDENPNKMEDERYELLVEAIREEGFLQPILALKKRRKVEIVDGHHRFWAAQEVDLPEIPVILISGISDDRALALGFGMNMKRGETDLSMAALLLQSIQNEFSSEELSVLSGFTQGELETLLEVGEQPTEEDLLADAADAEIPDEEEKPGKLFVLEISFDEKNAYKIARKRLKKAGSGDMGRGLLALLGVED